MAQTVRHVPEWGTYGVRSCMRKGRPTKCLVKYCTSKLVESVDGKEVRLGPKLPSTHGNFSKILIEKQCRGQ